jgi:biotin carboxyl carrier protein
MSYKTIVNDRAIDAEIQRRRPALDVKVGEAVYSVAESRCPPTGDFEVTIDGHIYRGWRYATVEDVYIRIAGRTHIVGVPQRGAAGAGSGASDNDIRADMPGTVVALHCVEGEAVASGQKLMTIESMKLQVGVIAPRDSAVAKIIFQANATFDRGAVLISLAPLDDGKKAKA